MREATPVSSPKVLHFREFWPIIPSAFPPGEADFCIEGRRYALPLVVVKDGESIEGAIRRFKRKCENILLQAILILSYRR